MKITDILIKKINIPLREKFTIAIGSIESLSNVYVEVQTDEGITGYGEGAPFIIVNGDNVEGTIESINLLKNVLLGVDPTDIQKVSYILNKSINNNNTAKAAIDMAIYDILAKSYKKPLYKVLGGYRDKVITDMTIGINSKEKMAADAKLAIKNGFRTLKVKLGHDPKEDLQRIESIRKEIGESVTIRIDANQGWNKKEAVDIINELSNYNIELIEQPVHYKDLEGLKFVTDRTTIPIMADESIFDSRDCFNLLSNRIVDLINIKLMKSGGITEAIKISSIAESVGIECMIGCMMETTLSITAASHLAAGLKNITRADLDSTLFLPDSTVDGGIEIKKDEVILPNIPGLGIIKI